MAAASRASGPGRNPERAFEFGGRLGMGDLSCLGFGDDDDVERRRHVQPARSEDLTHEALHTVANDGIPDPRAHGDPEARKGPHRGSLEDDEARRMATTAVALEGQKLPPPPQPDSLRVGAGVRHGSPRLFRGDGDGQPLATLGAAPLQHVSPGRCGHACPESVRALPLPVARLVRPLHREAVSQPRTQDKVNFEPAWADGSWRRPAGVRSVAIPVRA